MRTIEFDTEAWRQVLEQVLEDPNVTVVCMGMEEGIDLVDGVLMLRVSRGTIRRCSPHQYDQRLGFGYPARHRDNATTQTHFNHGAGVDTT
jgi:hypothetical protein